MKTLKISEKLSNNLALRETAREISKFLMDGKYDSIDFSGVDFVSRSFANELLNQEKKLKVSFEKVNMNREVKLMFDNALIESPKDKSASDFSIGSVDKVLSML